MEIDALEALPSDDSIAEGPHAIGNSIGRHASASTFAWVASTARLQQNLTDVHDWSRALGVDLKQEWLTWTSVLQTEPGKYGRPMRIQPALFRERFYHMGLLSKELRHTANDADEDQPLPLPIDDDQPEGADDAMVRAVAERPPRPRVVIDARQALQNQQFALMKEYLELCLKPGAFVSI